MDKISPSYQMKLVQIINDKLFEPYRSYNDVEQYLRKWHEEDGYADWENFHFTTKKLTKTKRKLTLQQLYILWMVNCCLG